MQQQQRKEQQKKIVRRGLYVKGRGATHTHADTKEGDGVGSSLAASIPHRSSSCMGKELEHNVEGERERWRVRGRAHIATCVRGERDGNTEGEEEAAEKGHPLMLRPCTYPLWQPNL